MKAINYLFSKANSIIICIILCCYTTSYAQDPYLVVYETSQGLHGYKTEDGKIVIPAKYFDAEYNFSHVGLAAVNLNKKWGFIDKTGKVVIPIKYDFVVRFTEGLAGVKMNDKWGFIDPKGNIIIPIIYDDFNNNNYRFSDGTIKLYLNGKEIVFDNKGNVLSGNVSNATVAANVQKNNANNPTTTTTTTSTATKPATASSNVYINQIPIAQNIAPNNVTTVKKTLPFNNATYEGDVDPQNQPHGKGQMTFSANEYYSGGWVNGKRQGYGVYQFANGDRYEGYFYNNLRHGEGKQILANGTVHSGVFERNEFIGKTILVKNFDDELVKYEGAIVVGSTGKIIPHENTKGKMELPGKWQYEGQMSYAMKEGYGKMYVFAEKKTIEATFKLDQIHGTARIMFANGDIAERVYNHGYFVREIAYYPANYNYKKYNDDDDD